MNKHILRLTGTGLALSLMAAGAMPAMAATSLSDISGHWAEEPIQLFVDKGYVNGMGDGTFAPEGTMTRAQFAKIINRVTGATETSDAIKNYTDVSSDAWYYEDMSIALAAGYMNGTSSTTMSPEASITREQAITMIARILGVESTDSSVLSKFPDAGDVSDWAEKYVAAMVASGDINGTDGKLDPSGKLTRAQGVQMLYNVLDDLTEEGTYVLMNIPYDEFYAADVNNSVAVDAITSATLSKTRSGSLAGGSYHVNSDGSDITGITFPVKVDSSVDLSKYKQVTDTDTVEITTSLRGQTSTNTYTGKDALFENESYAYYVLSETPSYYKEVTMNADGTLSFGELQGEVTTLEDAVVVVSTESNYGDYGINVSGITDYVTAGTDDVYAVILSTKEGNDYGLRHVENIWRVSQLAICTGFTTVVHSCPTSSDHYAAIMGQTITKVTYVTEKGIYEINCNEYVPVKFEGGITVADTAITAGSAAIDTSTLPADYQGTYTAEGLTVNGTTITWTDAKPGEYTVEGTDAAGKYADVSASFVLSTDKAVAAYDADTLSLIAAEGAAADDLSNYLGNITSVSVDGTSYSASGRNSVTIVNEDGSIELSADAFAEMNAGTVCELTVVSTGYPDLTFSLTIPAMTDAQKTTLTSLNEQAEALLKGYDEATASDDLKSLKEAYDAAAAVLANADASYGQAAGAISELNELVTALQEPVYVLMNVPYDVFYTADVNNSVKVDAITSATKSKTMNSNLVAGSYHVNSDGTDITGITFPVKVTASVDLSKYTQVTAADTAAGSDALFQNESYAYYVLSETPVCYKEVTVDADGNLSFGELQGEVTKLDSATAVLSTSSNYGDYQIDVSGITDYVTSGTDDVYAVILSTEEGADYGLRHLENIWRVSQLAFCTGFTTSAHGSPTSSAHYVAIMGQTIDKITYVTAKGIYEIDCDLYVPVKFEGGITVADTAISAGTASIDASALPTDYQASYTGSEGLTVNGSTITWTDVQPGEYTVQATDASGKYADVSTSFVLSTDKAVAAYSADTMSLTAAKGAAEDDLSNYLGNITSVSVNGTAYSASGRNSVTIVNENGYIDLSAEAFADMKAGATYEVTVTSTGYPELTFTVTIPDTIYAYASLTYAEYWANEGVYAAGDTTAATEADANGEMDTGAFDTVSRATSKHGWHRGSFQQVANILSDTDPLTISSWTDDSTVVLASGTTATWDSEAKTLTYRSGRNSTTANVTGYEITGIKYVPVAVAAEDYQAFTAAYTVTQNGETISGGYSEKALSAYEEIAAVTANTNGLKTVTRSGDTWSFSARTTGTDSGILGQAQATASAIETTVKSSSSYGDFIRVDLTGDDYGALGSMMQTVLWTYYGNDSTYTTPVATYGTKFAADNWMHKSMGIQLGLTKSGRCQIPDGYDGTGYWTVTVYALGYSDYTTQVQITADDLHDANSPMTDAQKTTLTGLKDQAEALLANYDEATASDDLKALKAHYDEAVALLANANATFGDADELIGELPNLIAAVQTPATEEPTTPSEQPTTPSEQPTTPSEQPATIADGEYTGTATVAPTATSDSFDSYEITVKVTVKDGKIESVEGPDYMSTPTQSLGYNMQAALSMPAKFAGKTADEVSSVDTVSGATLSSNAIKTAVSNALSGK